MSQPRKFKLGQSVELIGGDARTSPLGRFEVIRAMLNENGINQYRIRSLLDGHERMVREVELTGIGSMHTAHGH